MKFLVYILCIACLSELLNAKKSGSNSVLSGGSGHGCKGGGGALVMESGGKKGKKNEKLIIKDDALVMQDSEADGNLMLDGNNLILKEGKKKENIIIKGSGGGGHCCHQEVEHDKEVHVPHPIPIHFDTAHSIQRPTFVPVPVHFKKKTVHHHHTKEVHHHNDQLGLGSRRKDTATTTGNHNDTSIETSSTADHANEQQPRSEKKSLSKRKTKREKRVRKLKLGDKLSLKEKEHLKLQRVDKRLGLGRFKLAGRMMKRIRWRKNAQKTNSKDKSKEEINQTEQATKEDNGEQQYEEEDVDDGNKDQEDEAASSSLYESLLAGNALYPAGAINPISTGYMTNFNNMMDLYPPPPLPASVLPVSSSPSSSSLASDRRDVRKKFEKDSGSKSKKIKKLEHIKEDQIKTTASSSSESDTSSSEEADNEESNDQEQSKSENDNRSNYDLSTSRSAENSAKSINHHETTTSSFLPNNNVVQPIFTPDERQLSNQLAPAIYSLLAMTTNVQQRLALPPNPHHLPHLPPSPTATLPLYTPTKPSLAENSAALLLPLIAQQSRQQQQLIRAQQQKLLAQEAKQNELAKRLQQATAERQRAKDDFFKNEARPKSYEDDEFKQKKNINGEYRDDEQFISNERQKAKSTLMYSSDLDYWDKMTERRNPKSLAADKSHYETEAKFDKYDKASINRLRRRKSDEHLDRSKNSKVLIKKSKQDQHFSRQAKIRENDDEFDFSDFDNEDLRLVRATNSKSRRERKPRQQTFAKRMFVESTGADSEEANFERVTMSSTDNNVTNNVTNTASDYKASTINEVKLARNGSLIVYGY